MKLKQPLIAAALGAGVLLSTGAHATLTLNLGGQGVYDSDLNITWLRDANLAATNTFGARVISSGGWMNWYSAQNWIDAMNTYNYLGHNDWRLPTVTDIGAPGFSGSLYDGTGDHGYNTSSTGEMAHLWYSELGNLGYCSTAGACARPGWGLTNTDPFINVQSGNYWSATEYAPNTNSAWYFSTFNGVQGAHDKGFDKFAWAVRPGNDSATVPEPETVVMLLTGLGLLGFARGRRRSVLR